MDLKEYLFEIENILFSVKEKNRKISSIDIFLISSPIKYPKIEHTEEVMIVYNFFKEYLKNGITKELPEDIFEFENDTIEYKILKTLRDKTKIGDRLSYQELAILAGLTKTHTRVIGKIVSKNSFAIIFPCHRVIKSNKEIGGYKWGQDLKKILLKKEEEIIKNKLNFIT